MTPEQKAFFEYGGAWEQVVLIHKGIRLTIKALPGKTRQKLLRQARNETHQYELIRNAWKKRAACRAWNPPDGRDCPNCFYSSNRRCKLPCQQCWGHCLWEPRKEGE